MEFTLAHSQSTDLQPFIFEAPFTCITAGSTQSGKSTFWKELLQSRLIDPFPDHILWYHPLGTSQPLHEELVQSVPNITLHHGLPDFNNENFLATLRNSLIILDDLIYDLNHNDNGLGRFFAVNSHHLGASIVLLAQSIFFDNRQFRLAAANARYMLLFKSPRFTAQISHLARQMDQETRQSIETAYDDATNGQPYTYLLIDNSCNCPSGGRLRKSVLPRDVFNQIYL